MATQRKKKSHDNVDEVLHAQQKLGALKRSAQRRITDDRDPHSPTDDQAQKERASRGKIPMQGQQPLGGTSVRGMKKQRGRSSDDGLQGT